MRYAANLPSFLHVKSAEKYVICGFCASGVDVFNCWAGVEQQVLYRISAQRLHRVCFVHDNIISLSCECELVTDSSSAVHVCARLQPYLRKISAVRRISAVFFTYRDNSAKPNISRNFFPAIRNLKKNSAWGLTEPNPPKSTFATYVLNFETDSDCAAFSRLIPKT